jgi:pseudaminic acid biosynthesis-associated methylase
VINKEFFGKFSHSLNILEVGSNVGVQLELLRKLGFKNLFGIEINERAILQARKIHPHLNIIKGSGFNIPFRDKSFDLVFTSGVLIHINPKDLDEIMREIYRVSSKYIWGYEYYSDHLEEVGYRGKSNLIWKRNFAELYLKKFKDLSLIREKRLNIINSNNISQFFLLKK